MTHLIKAEWNELALEGQLIGQSSDVDYNTAPNDRLVPELVRQRLHRARMEVSFYAEIQARWERKCDPHLSLFQPANLSDEGASRRLGPITTYR